MEKKGEEARISAVSTYWVVSGAITFLIGVWLNQMSMCQCPIIQGASLAGAYCSCAGKGEILVGLGLLAAFTGIVIYASRARISRLMKRYVGKPRRPRRG
ncbi:Uncharacterised protein [uncultured archaeon]|nr:Uncharacterised protein [uncultured archaeon]